MHAAATQLARQPSLAFGRRDDDVAGPRCLEARGYTGEHALGAAGTIRLDEVGEAEGGLHARVMGATPVPVSGETIADRQVMSQRAMRISLQKGMETGCEIRKTIRFDNFVSRLSDAVLGQKDSFAGPQAQVLQSCITSSVTLLRAKPPKGGDAEPGDFGDRQVAMSARPPATRDDFELVAAVFVF